MNYYCGTDIIEVNRVKDAILSTPSFKEKILWFVIALIASGAVLYLFYENIFVSIVLRLSGSLETASSTSLYSSVTPSSVTSSKSALYLLQ